MISIIVVGYNSQKYLSDCMGSIFESTYKDFQVIFVDNNSKDESVKYIKKNFSKVLVLENNSNLGFAAGNNLGITKAISLKSDYIFLLNPDTIIDKTCLETLIKKINSKTILQPLILLHESNKKTNLINTTGNYLNYLGISYCNNYRKPSEQAVEESIPTASGAAMLIPSEVFRDIAMFDESFFMYHEDIDLCWRARMHGYDIKVIPSSIVWHKYSFSRNKNKFFYIERNRLIYLFKNFESRTIMLILPMLALNEILMLCYAIISGWGFLKIKASFSFISIMLSMKEKKKTKRRVTDSELSKYLSGQIDFAEVRIPLLKSYSNLSNAYWKMIKGKI